MHDLTFPMYGKLLLIDLQRDHFGRIVRPHELKPKPFVIPTCLIQVVP
jgi:hypothetical protein